MNAIFRETILNPRSNCCESFFHMLYAPHLLPRHSPPGPGPTTPSLP